MNNRRSAGRHRRRVTGRFYALLTLVVVLVVFGAAFAINRNRAPEPASTTITNTPDGGDAAEPTAPPDPADPPAQIATLEVEEDAAPLSDEDLSQVTNLSEAQGLSDDWRNILLLGADTRDMKKVARTDTLIIASINATAGKIKLTSIMRDLIVPLPNDSSGNPRQGKINSVIYYGGPELVMKTVNELFGMNISEYVMVNFASFQKVIDILGGIEVNVTQAEMTELNKSVGENAMSLGTMTVQEIKDQLDGMKLKTFGADTRLTGVQALGYARIRHIGDDYQRTERQRAVLAAVLKEVKKSADPIKLMQIANAMWGEFTTNISMLDAVGLATTVIQKGTAAIDQQARLPANGTYDSAPRNGISALWDCNFAENQRRLINFIYES